MRVSADHVRVSEVLGLKEAVSDLLILFVSLFVFAELVDEGVGG